MSTARRFLSDEGHAPARPAPIGFTAMLCIAAALIVLAVVGGCIIGGAR